MNPTENPKSNALSRRSFVKKTSLSGMAVMLLGTGAALALSPSDFAKEKCESRWFGNPHKTKWVYLPPIDEVTGKKTRKQLECTVCKWTSAAVPV
jgi:hypothetical protein